MFGNHFVIREEREWKNHFVNVNILKTVIK